MPIGERSSYAGGTVQSVGGIIGGGLSALRQAPDYAPMPILQNYGDGAIDQKLKEIDAEIANIVHLTDRLRGVSDELCGSEPPKVAELRPIAVANGLVDKLSSRKADLAAAAETLACLVTRLQSL